MRKQNPRPLYLEALLTKTFYPDTSSEHKHAVRYLEQANKTIENGKGKTSTLKK